MSKNLYVGVYIIKQQSINNDCHCFFRFGLPLSYISFLDNNVVVVCKYVCSPVIGDEIINKGINDAESIFLSE